MSFEVEKETIKLYKPLNTTKIKTVVDNDIVIPDTKPDVLNILEASALASIKEKKVLEDKILISGTVRYRLLFSGGEENIEIANLEYDAPFTEEISVSDISDTAKNYVTCRVSHIETRIENSRKINVKSVITLEPFAADTIWTTSVTKIESDAKVPYINEDIDALCMSVCEQSEFYVNDEIKLNEQGQKPEQILRCNSKVVSNEIKSMNNKLILKGSLFTNILYIEDGELYQTEAESPFTEVVDCEDLKPDMHTEITYSIEGTDYELSGGDNEDSISITSKIQVIIKAYESNNYSIISDVYSPDFEVETICEESDVFKVEDSFRESFNINETLTLGEGIPPIERIYILEADPEVESINCFENYAIVQGVLDTKIIYLSSSKSSPIYSVTRKIPFTYRINNKRINTNSIIDLDIDLEHAGYVIKSEKDIEVRASLRCEGKILSVDNLKIITSIDLKEELPIEKNEQPGIVIYFADKDEKLWDVAKRYNTLIEDIALVNEIPEDTVFERGQQIIIPKRAKLQ